MAKQPSPIKVKVIEAKNEAIDFPISIEGTVMAGFPSPANDYIENELNFKDLFLKNASSTFFVRVEGNSMMKAGILDGDILVVDKSLEPKDDSIIVCYLDGEFTVKKVKKEKGILYLMPENSAFSPIKIEDHADFRPWGIATFVIHKLR